MNVKSELRQALVRRELLLHYQPIIDLKTGGIAAAEALIRWQHPDRGLIHPSAFIPIAEESGLIVDIGEWVLEEACQRGREWRDITDGSAPVLNVNVSARHFQQIDVVSQVQRILATTDLEPGRLELEITESAMIHDAAGVAQTVRGLKSIGVRLAIDDFGAGYSSLSYLHSFDVDTLKVDQSFIYDVGPGTDSSKIVAAVIGLAHALGMNAVAEGVETELQAEQVKFAGCDFAQGYYFYQPMPHPAFIDVLRGSTPAHSP